MKKLKEIRLRAHAKINLYLDVLSKREDGYHNIETVFHSIGLYDDVILCERSDKDITISCNHPDVPSDNDNIAYRAAESIHDFVGGIGGLDIQINKRIPVAAGLAGGSANAAAVLYGVNELFKLGLSDKNLLEIGAKLGADVPFCLQGGAALGTGIGNRLKPLPPLKDVPLLLINPGIAVSTSDVFKNLHIPLTKQENGSIIMRKCVENGDIIGVANNLYNILESEVFQNYPILSKLKSQLSTQTGCYGTLMSGSGATIFAIMQDNSAATRSKSHFKNIISYSTITTTNRVSVCIDN